MIEGLLAWPPLIRLARSRRMQRFSARFITLAGAVSVASGTRGVDGLICIALIVFGCWRLAGEDS